MQKVRSNKILGCIIDQTGQPVEVLIGDDCKGNGVIFNLSTGEATPVQTVENHLKLHHFKECNVEILSNIYNIQKKSPHVYSIYLKLLNTKFDKYFQY